MKHQLSGTTVWCFVNTTSDPFTQYATVHSAEELYFLKRLLDAIFETYNTKGKEVMAITSLQALKGPIIKGTAGRESIGGANNAANTQTADKGLTREQAERMLQGLVLEGWFERSKDGYHTLSPRALMELRTWLVDTYNDSEDPDDWQRIKFCEACKNIVTAGLRCAERECNMRLHSICETAYWTSRPRKRCSRCDTAWDAKHFVGAKAVTGTKEPIREREQRGSNAGRSDSADAEESRHDESGIEEE